MVSSTERRPLSLATAPLPPALQQLVEQLWEKRALRPSPPRLSFAVLSNAPPHTIDDLEFLHLSDLPKLEDLLKVHKQLGIELKAIKEVLSLGNSPSSPASTSLSLSPLVGLRLPPVPPTSIPQTLDIPLSTPFMASSGMGSAETIQLYRILLEARDIRRLAEEGWECVENKGEA
ncbi:hypothetical protein JCM8547_006867 [Rhodosporidiobolus lusitaniae]